MQRRWTFVPLWFVLLIVGCRVEERGSGPELYAQAADGTASTPADTLASLGCVTDDVSGIPKTGWFPLGPTKDFVPLCSGEVILADTAKNQLLRKNVPSDTLLAAYGLMGKPGAFAFDAENGYLHAALSNSTVVRLELSTGALATISLPAVPLHLAVGNRGQLFASLRASDGGYDTQVAIIDGVGARVQRILSSDFGSVLVFERQRGKLLTADGLVTPSTLRRYAFDPDALTLKQEQELWDAGSRCLALSPDGSRLAAYNGGRIADYSSMNFSNIAGYWNTGSHPSAAAFSPDGRLLVTSDGVRVKVFDVETHALLDTYSPMGCSPYDNVIRVGFSRGGRIVFSLTECGFSSNYSIINWFVR
jgi:hypothetical protein